MAEGYQTDEEQVEALKKWWKENGQSTVIAIVVAGAGVFGWQGWQQQQQETIDASSAIYQNLLSATTANNGNPTAEQQKTANHLADTLKLDFKNSTYARFAALYKAKLAVETNQLATAEQELRWVLAHGQADELALQARLRLARVLNAQQQYEQALAELAVDASGYAAAFEEAKGDIYLAQGDKPKAKLAFQKSTELAAQGGQASPNPLLDMKLQQLTAELSVEVSAELSVEPPASDEAIESSQSNEGA